MWERVGKKDDTEREIVGREWKKREESSVGSVECFKEEARVRISWRTSFAPFEF